MRLLGVDTSSTHASVAIVENGGIICEKIYRREGSVASDRTHRNNSHAEILLPLIESALTAAGFSLGDISGFAVAIGPGSFTGLRIGLSMVKGLAYGCDVATVGISTLHASAARESDFNGVVCALLDARKKEVYAAFFRRRGGPLERLTEDRVMSFGALIDTLHQFGSAHPILLTGSGVTEYGNPVMECLGSHVRVRSDQGLPSVAGAVALLGEACFARGEGGPLTSLVPRYLHSSEPQSRALKLG
jgi:tRNA threonylcarbamoyladenosine biosynthesis protein TsaB